MERDECLLRSRCQAIPKIPIFPNLDSTVGGERSHGEHQHGNGDNHITSNGEETFASLIWRGLKEGH